LVIISGERKPTFPDMEIEMICPSVASSEGGRSAAAGATLDFPDDDGILRPSVGPCHGREELPNAMEVRRGIEGGLVVGAFDLFHAEADRLWTEVAEELEHLLRAAERILSDDADDAKIGAGLSESGDSRHDGAMGTAPALLTRRLSCSHAGPSTDTPTMTPTAFR
jgi:hypothetical protein